MAPQPRRSQRLKNTTSKPSTTKPKESPCNNDANNSESGLLSLSPELRLAIFQHLVIVSRPFMIGRCQDKTKSGQQRKTNGSPRDIFSFRRNNIRFTRDDSMHRPAQPAITRVCRLLRQEALPVFYSENEFWLTHNEFQPDDETQRHHRGFHAWMAQTPRLMFDYMQKVSLCGYANWPNRCKVDVNLKERKLVKTRHYSTYGDELPLDWVHGLGKLQEWSERERDGWGDGFEALSALLRECDWMFQISTMRIDGPPGMKIGVPPAEGWEYDF